MAQEEEREDGGIVGVARSMFLHSGYARTTIKSIAAAAGVAAPSGSSQRSKWLAASITGMRS